MASSREAMKSTKRPMKLREKVNVSKPARNNSVARPCPIFAAMRVASTAPRFSVSTARSTRPPSIGKAGRRLKRPRERFGIRSTMSGRVAASGNPTKSDPAKSNAPGSASAKLTSGPAMAICISSRGLCTGPATNAMPPMGVSRMSRTSSPLRRATTQWPSSCRVTPRSSPAKSRAMWKAWVRLSVPHNCRIMSTGRDQCMRTSIPLMRASVGELKITFL